MCCSIRFLPHNCPNVTAFMSSYFDISRNDNLNFFCGGMNIEEDSFDDEWQSRVCAWSTSDVPSRIVAEDRILPEGGFLASRRSFNHRLWYFSLIVHIHLRVKADSEGARPWSLLRK